jgi:hypothetical protein
VSTSIDVEFEEAPTANAGPDQSEEVCPGANALINLVGSGSGTGTLSYAWDFDASDGITVDSTEQNPQNVAFGEGIYTVTLTVTNDCGSASDEMILTITECINQAPVIGSIPIQKISDTAPCHVDYQYTLPASDPDGDKLTFTLVENKFGHIPSGMLINSVTGVISGNEDWVECCCGGERCYRCCTVWVKVKIEDDGCCQSLVTYVEFPIEIWYGEVGHDGLKKVWGSGFDNCPYFCN